MGKALFYHLTRNPMEVTAVTLLTRALAQGWRVAVRGGDQRALERLDQYLWTHSKAAFLPHGLAGGPQDAEQPILLTTMPAAPNAPDVLMLIDRAPVDPADVARHQRLWVLFDGHDEAALAQARADWKAMRAAQVLAEYWSEESGRWEKKAATGAA
ncbi:MAG: DNA polymerase III subunit chi [Roseinatronobacter sp.]